MTEAEWLACEDAMRMLDWLACGTETISTRWHGTVETRRWRLPERKLWLFAVAAHRPIADLVSRWRGPALLDSLERWAEGEITVGQLRDEVDGIRTDQRIRERTGSGDELHAFRTLWTLCRDAGRGFDPNLMIVWGPPPAASLLREIVGNPFRPSALDPRWLDFATGVARRLARDAYLQRDWAALPVLSDALEEAGCTDAALLSHLRSPGPHVRGCWALDLVLAKS
jgi:hypothetical protein